MAPHPKKIISKIVFILGSIYSLIYLFSCLTPYINPVHFYPLTFLALLFPYLLGGMVAWLVILLIFYRKRTFYFLIVTSIGFQNIHAVFSFHFPKEFVQQKDKKSIRVLSWNVKDFIDNQYHSDTVGNKRRDIMAFIKNMDPDIVCIQDFTEQIGEAFRSPLKDVTEIGSFPCHFFSIDIIARFPWAYTEYGTCIFSKYPIVDSGRFVYPGNINRESLAFADLKIGNDTLRVYNTHLQSMYLKYVAQPIPQYDFIVDENEFLANNPEPYQRLRHYDIKHVTQVTVAKPAMDATKYPYIFCADMNSVPSSYIYHQMSNGLTDAFLSKGSGGVGGTYDGLAPTLRIDVVLMSKQLKPIQYYSPKLHASDHFPIVTDIQFR